MRLFVLLQGLPRLILHAASQAASPQPAAGRLRRPFPMGLAALLGLLLVLGMRPAASADKPLVFGVFPNLTPKQIIEDYRPLANTLEQHLHRRVDIFSARDFKTFVARTRQGEYDLLLTAPHLAWLARQDAGYQPLLKYTQPVRGLLVVNAGSSISEVPELRGHTLAMADPLAVTVLSMQSELAAHGLRRNMDYHTIDAGSHMNALMQVINGRADGAVIGLHPYTLSPPDVRQKLRVLAETPPLSSLMYLTHPRLRDAEAQAIRQALLAFAATPAGKTFMQRGGYGGFSRVEGNELRAFRPYALQAQALLQAVR